MRFVESVMTDGRRPNSVPEARIGRVLAVQVGGIRGAIRRSTGVLGSSRSANQGGVAQGVAIAHRRGAARAIPGWVRPFRAGIADRLIGAVAGVLSILCARTSLASQLIFTPRTRAGVLRMDGRLVMYQLVRWAACFAILLIAATIIAFGRQMVRAERSHLIRCAVALHDGSRGLRQRRGMVFCARSHRHGLRRRRITGC